MNREDFKAVSSQLKKGSKVRISLSASRRGTPSEFTGSVKDRGSAFVEVGIKGIRGLHFLLFTQIESITPIEVSQNAETDK